MKCYIVALSYPLQPDLGTRFVKSVGKDENRTPTYTSTTQISKAKKFSGAFLWGLACGMQDGIVRDVTEGFIGDDDRCTISIWQEAE